MDGVGGVAANREPATAGASDSSWAECGEDGDFPTILDSLVPGVWDSDSLGSLSALESAESDTGESMLDRSPTLVGWDGSGSEAGRPLGPSDGTDARSDYAAESNAGLGYDVSPELLLPEHVEHEQWHATVMLADQSDSDSFSTDVRSNFSDHPSSANMYAGLGYDIPTEQQLPQPRSEIPSLSLSLSTTVPRHGAEIPPSKPARVAEQVPAKSPPLGAHVVKPKRAGADGAQAVCPLCDHRCEEQHRLGMYWRKFGYKGASCVVSLAFCYESLQCALG